MATAAKITVNLETQTAGWSKGLDSAGKEMKKWTGEISEQFKKLSFSGGTAFNIAGLAMFGSALNKVGKEAKEMATDLRTGKGAGEILSETLNKVPYVGAFKQGAEAIFELVTGTKAARIEAEKMTEHVITLGNAYRAMARERAGFGLYGQVKELHDADAEAEAKQDANLAKRAEIDKKYREVAKHDFLGYTDAQKAEMQRLAEDRKGLYKEDAHAEEVAEDKKNRITREAKEQQYQFLRQSHLATEDMEAKNQEKSLRRQGRGLESAVIAIKQSAKDEIAAKKDSISEYHLKQIADPRQRVERVESTLKEINSIMKSANSAVEDLQFEDARKQQETEKENIEKLKEITASGNIERLKIQDEAINAKNEKLHLAGRSHLAEAAQIEENHRKTIAEIEKKNREDRRQNEADPQQIKAATAAADMERDQKLGLSKEKEKIEAAKRLGDYQKEEQKKQEESLREQRKLWESVGDEAQKYAAHMEEINEHFEKFHDAKLKAAETGKLDQEAFDALKRQNPDHEAAISLYGRSGSYADAKVGGSGSAIAKQQLEAMKKTAADTESAKALLDKINGWLAKAFGGTAPELSI